MSELTGSAGIFSINKNWTENTEILKEKIANTYFKNKTNQKKSCITWAEKKSKTIIKKTNICVLNRKFNIRANFTKKCINLDSEVKKTTKLFISI
jgi:hypothetical protein